MKTILILTGFFGVQFADQDNGRFNYILRNDRYIEANYYDPDYSIAYTSAEVYSPGQVVNLSLKVECDLVWGRPDTEPMYRHYYCKETP